MKDARQIIKAPIVSEKSYEAAAENKYLFKVDVRANKNEIAKAIEEIFNVKVTDVNTMRRKGKTKRRGATVGRTAHWKRAVVQLREGDKIELYENR